MNFGKLNEKQVEEAKEVERAIDIIIRAYGIGQSGSFSCKLPYKGGVLDVSRTSKSSFDFTKSGMVERAISYISPQVSSQLLFLEGDMEVLAIIAFGPWIKEIKKVSEEALKFLESYDSKVSELSNLHQRVLETGI